MALSMVANGLSPYFVRNQLAMTGIKVHYDTIARWVGYYSILMENYSATPRVSAGFRWHVDEVCFKILAQKRYLSAAMDDASRFILSYEISPVKQSFDGLGLFARAAGRAIKLPRVMVSDRLWVFARDIRKIFRKRSGPRFVHIREIHMQNIHNHNNVQERLNGEFKDRLLKVRGIKASAVGGASDDCIPQLFPASFVLKAERLPRRQA